LFNVTTETFAFAGTVVPTGKVTVIDLTRPLGVTGSTTIAYCVPLFPIVEAGLALMPVKVAAKA
jgi:hypothetical protein